MKLRDGAASFSFDFGFLKRCFSLFTSASTYAPCHFLEAAFGFYPGIAPFSSLSSTPASSGFLWAYSPVTINQQGEASIVY